ncbi:MAG: transporter [Paracoccaceae bacterium]
MKIVKLAGVVAIGLGLSGPAAADETADLAQKLVNPLAAIISIPFQLNVDNNLGAAGTGKRTTLNFQPIIPFSLENGAAIITRTIIPYIWQEDVIPGTSQSGLGDILFNAWYSPASTGPLTWGVGPVVRIPTGSDVSTHTWAVGVTALGLMRSGHWTFGAMANHLVDIESNPRTPTNATFMQPFVAYSTKNSWTYSLQSETLYDWERKNWSVPVNFTVSKLAILGKVPVNFQGGVGYWVQSPAGGPEGWRFRLQMQIVIPKR